MPPPPPTDGGRAGNLCIYLVSCLLLTAILGGGTFLVLYIALPESEATAWFPIAGMVLVGMPWAFWMMTCLYRSVSMWRAAAATANQAPVRTTATGAPGTAAAPAAASEEAAVNSPGGERRVRFGSATVLSRAPEAPGRPEGEQLEDAADGENGEGSHASHESELPLFAMS